MRKMERKGEVPTYLVPTLIEVCTLSTPLRWTSVWAWPMTWKTWDHDPSVVPQHIRHICKSQMDLISRALSPLGRMGE